MINRYWLAVLCAALALGLWQGDPWLGLAGVLGLLIGASELLWQRYCLAGVEYERWLGANRALWGERVVLTVRLANRKLLPLPWLQVEDRVPEGLAIDGARLIPSEERDYVVFLRNLLPMLPFEQVVRRYSVQCRHRGRFSFGPGKIESGDILGFRRAHRSYSKVEQLVVYPKVFDLVMPAPLSRRIVGPRGARRSMFTDPSRTVGTRDYEVGDSLRHVDWRASARSTDLKVRIFEPSTDLALATFVNFQYPDTGLRRSDRDRVEFAISVAASVAGWGLGRGISVGLFANGGWEGMLGVRIPGGRDADQLRRVLEALALASPIAYRPLPIGQMLAEESLGMPFETSLLLVTAKMDSALLEALSIVARRRPLSVLLVGAEPPERRPASGIEFVAIPYDEAWSEREQLQLAS